MLIHATCVAVDGHGVVLRGRSGAGKSDLALRLIERGACLVADDQVDLCLDQGNVTATPPRTLTGKLEVRGVGIVTMPHVSAVPVRLVVDLVPGGPIERLPKPRTARLLKIDLPAVSIDPWEVSAPSKVRLALALFAATTDVGGDNKNN